MAIRVRAAVILRLEGAILIHRDRADDFWALPGGAVEPGERSAETARREIREELGWDVRIGGLAGIHEQSFDWRGRTFHELVLYFTAAAESPDAAASRRVSGEFPCREPHLLFRWLPVDEVAQTDLRPIAARQILLNDTAAVLHLVN